MLETGQNAPNFTLVADNGDQVSLSDFRGQQVVVYFYPKADTAGCTKQACAVRDNWVEIEGGDATVIGISPDQPEALTKFREKYTLPFVLLSDPDHTVAEMYGAWGEKTRGDKTVQGIIRSHFGVDREGKLFDVALQVKPETTADLALRLVNV